MKALFLFCLIDFYLLMRCRLLFLLKILVMNNFISIGINLIINYQIHNS